MMSSVLTLRIDVKAHRQRGICRSVSKKTRPRCPVQRKVSLKFLFIDPKIFFPEWP